MEHCQDTIAEVLCSGIRSIEIYSKDFATATARLASGAQPSAPICLAKLSVMGAPPIITFTCWRNPAACRASMVIFMFGMVVVSRADIATRSAWYSRTAATNLSAETSVPRSTISKPAPSSIIATKFFPMSCRSPLTVPITTRPGELNPEKAIVSRDGHIMRRLAAKSHIQRSMLCFIQSWYSMGC